MATMIPMEVYWNGFADAMVGQLQLIRAHAAQLPEHDALVTMVRTTLPADKGERPHQRRLCGRPGTSAPDGRNGVRAAPRTYAGVRHPGGHPTSSSASAARSPPSQCCERRLFQRGPHMEHRETLGRACEPSPTWRQLPGDERGRPSSTPGPIQATGNGPGTLQPILQTCSREQGGASEATTRTASTVAANTELLQAAENFRKLVPSLVGGPSPNSGAPPAQHRCLAAKHLRQADSGARRHPNG